MTTVHLVFNAHIDPVWLWPWQAGVDEVLATCRSACDRLDRHPDIVFTRGEAWVYHIVERVDPRLFERIRAHVAAGRWEITGGWWIQPDCNQPTGIGFSRQIALGKEYFLSRFGVFPRVGYNVDSFGHAAALPRIMHQHGQDRYVMMRPQEHEMDLPARLFRWRGENDDDPVVTFRIADMYATIDLSEEHVLAAVENLPQGVSHTMCFVGIGDHGGGPSERQIEWCRAHAQSIAGCRLVFSSPSRFFDAIEAEAAELPLVTGELHYHAVGCYSVMRPVKVAMRRAEYQLQQAEIAAALDPRPEADVAARLNEAWRHVCFNQFHDTLGGSCIPSAYAQVIDQLGAAAAVADEIVELSLRRRLAGLKDNRRQRIALFNACDSHYEGYVVLAPWTELPWRRGWRILGEDGASVPYQLMASEAAANYLPRVLLRVRMAPREVKILRIDRAVASKRIPASNLYPTDISGTVELGFGATAVKFGADPRLLLGDQVVVTTRLELFEDPTDTWSHGVDRLGSRLAAVAQWSEPILVDDGPLMRSAIQQGTIGRSDLLAEWRVYADEPIVELLLRVHWHAAHQVLKLSIPVDQLEDHCDGVLGGVLRRRPDGKEYPLRDFTWLHLQNGRDAAIVCPDVFALDAVSNRLRLTLLRSPLMAHHTAPVELFPRALHADQGLHEFRFQFVGGPGIDLGWLEQRAAMLNFPPVTADLTKGMVARSPW